MTTGRINQVNAPLIKLAPLSRRIAEQVSDQRNVTGKGRENPRTLSPIALMSGKAVRHLSCLSIPIETGGAVPRTLGQSKEVRLEL